MFRPVSRFWSIFFLWSAFLFAVMNAVSLVSPVLGGLFAVIFLWNASKLLGPTFLPKQHSYLQTAAGFMAMMSIIALVVGGLYYALPITQPLLFAVFFLIAGFITIAGRNAETREKSRTLRAQAPLLVGFCTLAVIVSLIVWLSAVSMVEITDSVRSPWNILSANALIPLGIAFTFLLALFHRARAKTTSLVLFIIALFAGLSLTAIVYPNGFGFDPFIHRATVAHIIEFGTITPKPLYYIGQYAIELSASHVFSLPIELLDPFLVPLLGTFILTFTVLIAFSQLLQRKPFVVLPVIFFLPLGAFIMTTPQALAYLFTAALMFLSLPALLHKEHPPSKWLLALLTAAALITHPLAGIPATMYFVLFLISTQETGYPAVRTGFFAVLSVLGAIAMPIVFYVQAKLAELPIHFNAAGVFDLSNISLTFFLENRYSVFMDALYLVIDNLFWITLLFAGIGVYFLVKQKVPKTMYLPLVMALILFINYWILSTTLEFDFLIEYERANYADRLLFLTHLFLLPTAGVAIAGIHQFFHKRPTILHWVWILLLGFMMTAGVYGAYPRHDNYARSAGFNVGINDFDAVYAIDEAGEVNNFVVLANQAVSAAALESFGFKTYYEGDIFYYPIPTGGELYSIFLDMVEDEPTRAYALDAMDLADVDTAYFVVNDYWWQADIIKERAKAEADDWFSVGDGAVTIFEFTRSASQ